MSFRVSDTRTGLNIHIGEFNDIIGLYHGVRGFLGVEATSEDLADLRSLATQMVSGGSVYPECRRLGIRVIKVL